MSDLLETHSVAWARVWDWRKRSNQGSWISDEKDPIRMRGYTELILGNLDPKLRKKLDTALKRGYALEDATQLKPLLRLIEDHHPEYHIPIGYVGKTEMWVFAQDENDARSICDELNALSVLTDSFKGNAVRRTPGFDRRGYCAVRAYTMRKGVGHRRAAHLISAFKEMRPSIDLLMEKDAAVREKIARWCATDNRTIRIPFDSHKDRGKQ